jgi:hypothetical protein
VKSKILDKFPYLVRFRHSWLISEAARKIENLIKRQGIKEFKLTYSNRISPPTYGDFLVTVFLARFLESIGCVVEFYIDDSDRRSDWGDLHSNGAGNHLVFDQFEIVKLLLKKEAFAGSPLSNHLENESNKFDLNDLIEKTHLPYVAAGELTSKLYKRFQKVDKKDFLLGFESLQDENFIAIAFRRSELDKARNTNLWQLENDIKLLSDAFKDKQIRIFTEPMNRKFLKDVICNYERKIIERIEFQKSDNFVGAISELNNAYFYLQRSGGGLAIISVYSKCPYFIDQEAPHYFFGARKNHIAQWSTSEQFFNDISWNMPISKYFRSKNSLEKFFAKNWD